MCTIHPSPFTPQLPPLSVKLSSLVRRALFLVAASCVAFAQQTDHWFWCDPTPTGSGLWAITYANGLFVAVGTAGSVVTSADGQAWVQRDSGTISDLNAVASGGGQFVATSFDGTIVTSPDGQNWRVTRTGAVDAQVLTGVAYGNGQFVALGWGSTILISTNGNDWVDHTQPALNFKFVNCTFGNGRFVGTSEDFGYSSDGVTWSKGLTWLSSINALGFGNGQFVAVDRGARFLSSVNGVSWRQAKPLSWGTNVGGVNLHGITWGNGVYLAVGDGGGAVQGLSGLVASSSDGLTWTQQALVPNADFRAVAYGSGTYVAVGGGIWTSPDGSAWTRQGGRRIAGQLYQVTYGDGLFVGVGQDIATSADGLRWTPRSSPTTNALYGVAYGASQFVAVGDAGTIANSTNGIAWRVSATAPVGLHAVSYGNGLFVAVGEANTALVSSNGVDWVSSWLPHDPWVVILGITFRENEFVIVDSIGEITSSPDGMTWTPVATSSGIDVFGNPVIDALDGIAYGNGKLVAVGIEVIYVWDEAAGKGTRLAPAGGCLDCSRDPWDDENYGVVFADGRFLVVGGYGHILSSTNGLDWSLSGSTGGTALYTVAQGNGMLVAAGYGGILESGKARIHLDIGSVAESGYRLTLSGLIGGSYQLQCSSDLTNWVTLSTLVATNSILSVTDAPPANVRYRFYRAVSP